MRKYFIVIIITLFAFQLQAQYKPVKFGLRVAPNIGWLKPDTEEYDSEGVTMGFTWGFIGEFFLMENYAIVTGFNVNFNGGKLQYPAIMSVPSGDTTMSASGQLHRKYDLKFIQIPLYLKMQTDVSEKFTLFGKIGLGTAFNLSAKGTDEFEYEGGTESSSKKDIGDDISLMRESLIVGGGAEYKLKGSTAIILELTYDNAFNNMLSGDNPAVQESKPKAYHNFVELGIGVVF
jgi:opacity protein-like surface antigen